MEFFLGSKVSEDAKEYPHAVGEVQKHEHHFETPENIQDAPFEHHHSLSQSTRGSRLPKRTAHEDAARRIAEAGKEWADRVLRKDDMLIYVYRLLLEYARIVDDRKERIGWAEDLL
jgi:hypothetical protein